MSAAPVDVLAVMGTCAALLADKPSNMPQTAADLRDARDAVLDLIEAAKGTRDFFAAAGVSFGDESPLPRLDAALARVGAP